MKTMYNTIWSLEKEILQQILDSSNTLAEAILRIGLSLHGNNYKELNNRIKADNLSLEILNQNRKGKSFGGVKAFKLDDVLVESSTYSRRSLKIRLVENNLIEYKCSSCNNIGQWNNKKLTLQLDHINGINTDNRLENLRFLCPNCHSQTDTYTGKNAKRINTQTIENRCLDCNCSIYKKSTRCLKCSRINKPNYKFEVTKEELELLIKEYPMTYIAKKFAVSNTAIKKRCIKLNIDYKTLKII